MSMSKGHLTTYLLGDGCPEAFKVNEAVSS